MCYYVLMPKNSERDFQKFIKTNWSGFLSQLHPSPLGGSDIGIPDLLLGASFGLLPCELKIGSISDNVLSVSEVRPSQISWHRRLAKAGFESIFLVGVWAGGEKGKPNDASSWRAYAIDGDMMEDWDNGFEIEIDAFEINTNSLMNEIDNFVFDYFGA